MSMKCEVLNINLNALNIKNNYKCHVILYMINITDKANLIDCILIIDKTKEKFKI